MEIDEPKDWNVLDKNYVQNIIDDQLYLDVK